MNQIREYLKQGWKFVYDPETAFIGIEHPRGGNQSLCDLRHGLSKSVRDDFGRELEAFLNSEYGVVRELMCDCLGVEIPSPTHVIIRVPEGQCTDMSGAIQLAQRVAPDVSLVETWVGDARDTCYACLGGQWVAQR